MNYHGHCYVRIKKNSNLLNEREKKTKKYSWCWWDDEKYLWIVVRKSKYCLFILFGQKASWISINDWYNQWKENDSDEEITEFDIEFYKLVINF